MVQSTIRTETLFKSVLLSQGNGLELIVPKKLNSTGIFVKNWDQGTPIYIDFFFDKLK